MDWLIGIGRSRLGTGGSSSSSSNSANNTGNRNAPSSSSSSVRTIETPPQIKSYMTDTENLSHLVDNITKDNIQETVPAPVGVDINEWLATNTLSFFTHISLIYDSLNEFCTPTTCACANVSAVGTPMNFTWVDDRGKKVRLSAPQYIELVIVQIEKYVTDETIFPTKYDMLFPTNFLTIVRKIFRMLFHILIHIYQSHYEHITELEHLSILNTVFIHFMYFQIEHNLLETKEVQNCPLEELIKNLCL